MRKRVKVLMAVRPAFERELVEYSLTKVNGIERVFEAHDGLEAEEILEEQRQEIVIMDARMPGKDGIDLLRKLKGAGSKSAPKVIMNTNVINPGRRQECTQLGADHLLAKAIDHDGIPTIVVAVSKTNSNVAGKSSLG